MRMSAPRKFTQGDMTTLEYKIRSSSTALHWTSLHEGARHLLSFKTRSCTVFIAIFSPWTASEILQHDRHTNCTQRRKASKILHHSRRPRKPQFSACGLHHGRDTKEHSSSSLHHSRHTKRTQFFCLKHASQQKHKKNDQNVAVNHLFLLLAHLEALSTVSIPGATRQSSIIRINPGSIWLRLYTRSDVSSLIHQYQS